jgi:hypothetical protein
MNKKDLIPVAGLLATASLAVISGGLITPVLGSVCSNIGSSLAANFLTGFTPAKIKRLFVDIHPNDLNHSIKKLFVASINDALNNIAILFSETQVSDNEKKQVKQLIKTLQKQLPSMFLNSNEIQLEEPEIKCFLYEKNKEEMICRYIANHFANFGITDPFKTFLAQNLPAQIQLCFGEGLKNPDNRNAWVAFRRMLMEEIRSDIKQIADTQQSIKDDLSDLKFTKSGFSKKQIEEIRQLTEILNDKKLVEVKIKSSIDKNLKSIEDKANEIIQITTKTQLTVNELKTLTEKIKRQNRTNQIIIAILSGCLLVAAAFVAYKLINQPFTATVKVYGWENEQHNPLNGKGSLVLTLGDKTEKAEINRQGEAVFKGILPKYNGKIVEIQIIDTEGEPYYLPDSIIKIQKNVTTKVQLLLHGLEKLQGTVFDDISGEGLPDVSVTVAELSATTDANGYFSIEIPIEKQRTEQKILIRKDGYESLRETVSMTGEYNVVLKKVKGER